MLLSENFQEKSIQDRIRVFRMVIRDCIKAQKTTIHSHNNPFLAKKVVKNGYYGNKNFSLALDRIEVFRNHVRVNGDYTKVFEIAFRNYIRA